MVSTLPGGPVHARRSVAGVPGTLYYSCSIEDGAVRNASPLLLLLLLLLLPWSSLKRRKGRIHIAHPTKYSSTNPPSVQGKYCARIASHKLQCTYPRQVDTPRETSLFAWKQNPIPRRSKHPNPTSASCPSRPSVRMQLDLNPLSWSLPRIICTSTSTEIGICIFPPSVYPPPPKGLR